jgi:hypothetical protein
MLFTTLTHRAFTAAYPWIDDPTVSHGNVLRIRPDCDHFPENFMAKHMSFTANIQHLASAKFESAVMEVYI